MVYFVLHHHTWCLVNFLDNIYLIVLNAWRALDHAFKLTGLSLVYDLMTGV